MKLHTFPLPSWAGWLTLGATLLSAGCGALPSKPRISVEELTLDNGLVVLLSKDDRLPMVAVEVRYKVGSAVEQPGKSGFAHLFEHLMFQGSAGCDDEYFKPFAALGGKVNGTTNTDRTNYFEQVPKTALELALFMEADRMKGLLGALSQEKLDNQRDVVKNERRQRYENTPYGTIWKRLGEILYPEGHPYHHATIGSHEDLSAASLDDARTFFRAHYGPDNAILTVVGDFDRATALRQIKAQFGGIARREAIPVPPVFSTPKLGTARHLVEYDDVKLPRIYLAWHTPSLYADGDSAMDVLASVLTEGKTSRLHRALVFDKKVAQQVAAYQVSRANGSFFVVQATAAPGVSVDDLAAALLPALDQALASRPTASEMRRAINGWKKSFYARVEGLLQRAHLLAGYAHLAGKADYVGTDLARYEDLTGRQVYRAARRWLGAAERVRIDIKPEPEAGGAP